MDIFLHSIFEIGLIFIGVFLVFWGRQEYQNEPSDITLQGMRLIFLGTIGIILGILGLFNVIPWGKL